MPQSDPEDLSPKETNDAQSASSDATPDAAEASKYFRFTPIDREERLLVLHDEKYTDGDPAELTFVHIGKCGGYTVADALAISPVVQERFSRVKRIHIRPPYYQKHAQYLIVLRNPIERLCSAFEWRYQKVVASKEQEFRYAGEYEALSKYGGLNDLAEQIFRDGDLRIDVVSDMLKITHFNQDMNYYLGELLGSMRSDQIFSVFTQETLRQDMRDVLGVNEAILLNKNASDIREASEGLSAKARQNLKRFFARDYDCIRALDALYPLGSKKMDLLLQ